MSTIVAHAFQMLPSQAQLPPAKRKPDDNSNPLLDAVAKKKARKEVRMNVLISTAIISLVADLVWLSIPQAKAAASNKRKCTSPLYLRAFTRFIDDFLSSCIRRTIRRLCHCSTVAFAPAFFPTCSKRYLFESRLAPFLIPTSTRFFKARLKEIQER